MNVFNQDIPEGAIVLLDREYFRLSNWTHIITEIPEGYTEDSTVRQCWPKTEDGSIHIFPVFQGKSTSVDEMPDAGRAVRVTVGFGLRHATTGSAISGEFIDGADSGRIENDIDVEATRELWRAGDYGKAKWEEWNDE